MKQTVVVDILQDEVTFLFNLAAKIIGYEDRKLVLPPHTTENDVVGQACALAARSRRDGRTVLTSFQAHHSLTVRIADRVLKAEPLTVIPLSYFGVVEEVTDRDRKLFGYKNTHRCVRTDSGEYKLLAPGDRVYQAKTGTLLHSEPT